MSRPSPKTDFLKRTSSDDDGSESLIKLNRTHYNPNPTGTRFHLSLARTKITRGGLGSGKTRCVTEHINQICLAYPGALTLIGRRDMTSLKVTTQREFLENVVAPETVAAFNSNDNILYYKNGSIVLFRETKEPDKVKSLELAAYMLDECDENPTNEIWEKLDDRLRQKIQINGKWVIPPYCGALVFNPTDEDHWLYELAQRTDIDVEDFRFDTEDNADNLPPDYIPNLKKKLPPWEINRLVHGHWGKKISGKPVYHGFTDNHIRVTQMRPDLPLLRGWDFGYRHPAVRWAQIDPLTERFVILDEFLGKDIKLQDTPIKPGVVSVVRKKTIQHCGLEHPIFNYGDPHGADEKDVGESSIEHLRIHHKIHIMHRTERIKTGMDEIQMKIVSEVPLTELETQWFPGTEPGQKLPLMVVDHQCKITNTAYQGGYHRDPEGQPVKDGYYDHLMDCDRIIIVNNMGIKHRAHKRRPRVPKNLYTGY